MKRKFSHGLILLTLLAITCLAPGCATSKVNWENRVGNFTFDQAVLELGPPERSAELSDGRRVAEWLTYRSRPVNSYHYSSISGGFWPSSSPTFPDRFLRLTFSPE